MNERTFRRVLASLVAIGVVAVMAVAMLGSSPAPAFFQDGWRVWNQHATETPLVVASRGFSDTEALHKFGRNPDIDSAAAEDVWAVGGLYTFPTVAETVDVVSDDATDTAAGVGAREIRIQGLDANYLYVEEDLLLNGLTTVTTTQTFLRVHRALVLHAGTDGSNAGNVNAEQSTSGLVLFQIRPMTGQTTLGLYTVPADKRLVVVRLFASIGRQASGGATLEFLVRDFDPGGFPAFRVINYAGLHSQGVTYAHVTLPLPILVQPRTDILMRVGVTANNSDLNAGFDGYLVPLQ